MRRVAVITLYRIFARWRDERLRNALKDGELNFSSELVKNRVLDGERVALSWCVIIKLEGKNEEFCGEHLDENRVMTSVVEVVGNNANDFC